MTKVVGWTLAGVLAAALARAYNVPVNAAVYRLLLEGGVDVIGTKRLSASRQVLLTLGVDSLH